GVTAAVRQAAEKSVQLELKIAPDAPPGLHQLRLVTPQGISNPQPFYVAEFPEIEEKEPNNTLAQANPISIPVVIRGSIDNPQRSEDQDNFSFTAHRGDRLVFEVDNLKRHAPRENRGAGLVYLDSYLTLYDAAGRELAANDDTIRHDARICYEFTKDGQ